MIHQPPPPTHEQAYEIITKALKQTSDISINDQATITYKILQKNKSCDPYQPLRLRQGEEIIGFVNVVQSRNGPLRSVDQVAAKIQNLVETHKIFKRDPSQFIPTGNGSLIQRVDGIRVENQMLIIGNHTVATPAAAFISEDVMKFKKLDAVRFSLGAPGGDPPFYFDLRQLTADGQLQVLRKEPEPPSLFERTFYSVKVFLQL
ncbi:MAG: hypothetical protein ChlgKO_12250 [Chlamydiales bacterium]